MWLVRKMNRNFKIKKKFLLKGMLAQNNSLYLSSCVAATEEQLPYAKWLRNFKFVWACS